MQPLVNFILGNYSEWTDIAAEESCDVPLSELTPRIRMGREIWLVQAFQLIRKRGYRVTLSAEFAPEAINIAHCDDIRPSPDLWKYFIVSVRADRDPAFVSQLEIVQNRFSVWSESDYYIPHWPQPGLLPRDPGRGTKVENVVYMGKADNLEDAFKAPKFRRELNRMGMRLLIQEDAWWDYREADVVLAVRGGPRFYLSIKPAAKLVNAWLAGCPAILSPEPGYTELRQSDEDYIEATQATEALAALLKLRRSPELMSRMIANGKLRGADYEANAILNHWEKFLEDVAVPEFEIWKNEESERYSKFRYYKALLKRRFWGNWAIGNHKSSWKEGLGRLRRQLLLPRSESVT